MLLLCPLHAIGGARAAHVRAHAHADTHIHTHVACGVWPQDIHRTKALHDAASATAAFPPTPLRTYLGAYFEARCGGRGGSPPTTELALAQLLSGLQVRSRSLSPPHLA